MDFNNPYAVATAMIIASSEQAPSMLQDLTISTKPAPGPLQLAMLHQAQLRELRAKVESELGCIRQLLTGRHVREKRSGTIHLVSEVRAGTGLTVVLYGRSRRSRSAKPIGTIADVELLDLKEL